MQTGPHSAKVVNDPPAPLRIGLFGCGAVSRLYYAPALATLVREGEVEVCTLFDPDAEAVDDVLSRLPAATPISSIEKLPAGLDLGIVASPPAVHAEQTIRLLRGGVSVLCEKPMAPSSSECRAMVAAADESGRLLTVGMVRRFLPAVDVIGKVLRSGLLGSPLRISCREGGAFDWPTRATSFFEKRAGGVLMDIGVHVVDLLTHWMGFPEDLVYEDDAMGGVEANCRLQLRFTNDTQAEIRLSRDSPQPNRYVFTGSEGWLSWHLHEPDGLRMGFHGATHALDSRLCVTRPGLPHPSLGSVASGIEEAFVFQLRNVVGAVRGVRKAAVGGKAALSVIDLIEQCYASGSLMPMPWLTDAELAAALNAH